MISIPSRAGRCLRRLKTLRTVTRHSERIQRTFSDRPSAAAQRCQATSSHTSCPCGPRATGTFLPSYTQSVKPANKEQSPTIRMMSQAKRARADAADGCWSQETETNASWFQASSEPNLGVPSGNFSHVDLSCTHQLKWSRSQQSGSYEGRQDDCCIAVDDESLCHTRICDSVCCFLSRRGSAMGSAIPYHHGLL
jgi:hypothetical protein